jgi:hypothetical protein
MMRGLVRTFTFIGVWAGLGHPVFAQELTEATYSQWKEYILTKPEELSWKAAIAWEQNLGQGILRSQRADKPLLLWVEAGDPQGCV